MNRLDSQTGELGRSYEPVISYCRVCVVPSTRPNGHFNEHQVCSACEFNSASRFVSFENRLHELRAFVSKTPQTTGRFDAIVGVSGGKDSTRQALWVKNTLGLRVLLVSVLYPSRQGTHVGMRNLANLAKAGFDVRVLRPAPLAARALFREGLLRFGNAFKASEMALFSGCQRIALGEKIPIVFLGENPALQVGDYGTLGSSIWDGDRIRESNTLSGGSRAWFEEALAGNESALEMYTYPSKELLQEDGVRTIYIGPAIPDWGNVENALFSLMNGFSLAPDDGRERGDLYRTEMIDDDLQTINFLLKYFKFGFSRGTEQASTLIRKGRISRAEGARIAAENDPVYSDDVLNEFCEYARISKETFWELASKWGNHNLFDFSVTPPKPKFFPGEDLVR